MRMRMRGVGVRSESENENEGGVSGVIKTRVEDLVVFHSAPCSNGFPISFLLRGR